MLLEIDDSKTIGDLQEKFFLCFPNLKIEFCRKSHHWEELSDETKFLPPGVKIGSIRSLHHPGILEIRSEHKAGEVEKRFRQRFGLMSRCCLKETANGFRPENQITLLSASCRTRRQGRWIN